MDLDSRPETTQILCDIGRQLGRYTANIKMERPIIFSLLVGRCVKMERFVKQKLQDVSARDSNEHLTLFNHTRDPV